jgi:DNA primase
MRIDGYNVPVDIEAELDGVDWGHNARRYPDKIHACCPFRDESTPSFVVFLDKGNWVDMGFARPGYEKGDFITLLAYLKGTDREAISRYLIRKYMALDVEGLALKLKLTLTPSPYPIMDSAVLDNLHPCEYLFRRGIDYKTQERFRVGYHAFKKAAVLPWFDTKGNLVNVKYRAVEGKAFQCADGGQHLNGHLFGWAQSLGTDRLFVTEAEIDSLYLAANGYTSVALGTAHLSPAQEKLIIKHPAKTLIIATDSDKAGEKCANDIARRLGGYKVVERFQFPDNCKDVNDVKPLTVKTAIPQFFLDGVGRNKRRCEL